MSKSIEDILANIEEELKVKSETLRAHQRDGIKFALNSATHKHGCILADEMGLGKTCQAVVAVCMRQFELTAHRWSLVVCPLSVLDTWQREIARFGCGLRVCVYRGDADERARVAENMKACAEHVLLTTYEMLLKDIDYLTGVHWHTVVVDEAHRLKSSTSQTYQAVAQVCCMCTVRPSAQLHRDYLLLLTGTPIQNNVRELYALLSLIDPARFDADAADPFVAKYSAVAKDAKLADEIRALLGKYMIRRVKDDVPDLEIPEKSVVNVYHGLSKVQTDLYRAILSRNHESFSNITTASGTSPTNQQSLMNILMQLRKCVNHPYLFDGVEPEPFVEGDHLITASGKLVALDSLLAFMHARKHRVLIFSQMTAVLDILQDYLTFKGYSYERLDGSVRSEERFASMRRFNENSQADVDGSAAFVFLLSTRAGGLGITLTGADTVIFYDSDFNPQNDLQAAARAHRIGQDKSVVMIPLMQGIIYRPVKIVRLIARHTVEEVIAMRAERKLRLTNAITGEGETDIKSMSLAEIREMLAHGLAKLSSNVTDDQSDAVKIDEKQRDEYLNKVIGETDANGHWMKCVDADDKSIVNTSDLDESTSIYYFAGKDYKPDVSRRGNEDALQQLIDEGRRLGLAAHSPTKQQRSKPIESDAERVQRIARERAIRDEKRRAKLEKLWTENNYTSTSVGDVHVNTIDVDDDAAGERMHFVVGDVSKPKPSTTGSRSLVVHCVDDSGDWGRGGVFDALVRNVGAQVRDAYELASTMKDLHIGQAHVIHSTGSTATVCLLVGQSHRARHTINAAHMDAALRQLAAWLTEQRAAGITYSVHVPRIGYGMPGVQWYAIERQLRRHMCAAACTHVYVYYYRQRQQAAQNASDSDDESPCAKRVKRGDEPIDNGKTPHSGCLSECVLAFVADGTADADAFAAYTRDASAHDALVTDDLDVATHVVVIGKHPPQTPVDHRYITERWLIDSLQRQQCQPINNYAYVT